MLRIKELRRARGLSQERLAYLAGLSVKTVQRSEGNGGLHERTLRKIAKALGVEPGDLFEHDEKAVAS